MSNVVGIKIVTGTLFFATAVGAPVAAWLSNQPFEPAHQLAALSEGNFEVQPPDDWLRLEPGEVVELIQVDRVIISAALQTKSERAKAKKDCYDHYSQKLATGKVRICDVARSSNVRSARVLVGRTRKHSGVERKVPRDQRNMPSPSGLLRQ